MVVDLRFCYCVDLDATKCARAELLRDGRESRTAVLQAQSDVALATQNPQSMACGERWLNDEISKACLDDAKIAKTCKCVWTSPIPKKSIIEESRLDLLDASNVPT